MLTTNRRLRTLFMALAGMEAVITAVGLLLLFRLRLLWQEGTPPSLAPMQLVLGLWLGLLALLIAIDLLTRSRLSDRGYRVALLALVLVTGAIMARGFAGATSLFDLRWLPETAMAAVNFHRGLHPGTFGVILAFYLWWRASTLADRDVTFFGIGISFRLGFLMLIGGGGWLALRNQELIQTAIWLLALFLTLGLTAVALARSDEKASGAAGSAGSALSFGRLLQLLLAVGIIVGISLWIGVGYSPADMRATLAQLDPLWRLFRFLGQYVLIALVFVLEIVVGWLFELIAPLLAGLNLADALAEFAQQFPVEQQPEAVQQSDPWPYAGLLLTVLRVVVVTVAGALVLLFLYIFFVRRLRQGPPEESEITGTASANLNTNPLRSGMDRLRRWADLLRQYGLGAQLLDAVTVENIYANLTRIARRRGHPRRAAQPPDEYLSALILAFPGHDAALQRITNAYMRVHYGDHPVGGDELRVLREDYDLLRSDQAQES